jgi:hypothetical protein
MKQISRVHKLSEEPILVVTNQGILCPEHYDFRKTCAAIAEALDAHHLASVYLISDDRGLSIPDFEGFAAVITDAVQNVRGPGSPSDPRILGGAIVSDQEGLRIWSDFLGSKDLYGLAMPVFETMDDALAYARRRIADAHPFSETGTIQPNAAQG